MEMSHITQEAVREPGALEPLVAYLRDNPEAISADPVELGAELGLPAEFVESVQTGLRGPGEEVSELVRVWAGVRAFAIRAVERGSTIWEAAISVLRRMTDRPVPFLMVTVFTMVGVLAGQRVIRDWAGPLERVVALFALVVLLGLFGLQLICFFRHGQARYPFIGAGLFAGSFVGFMVLEQGLHMQATVPMPPFLMIVLAGLMVGALYAGFGFGASLAGGFIRLNKESRQERLLTRQALVGRMLELEKQLATVERGRLTEGRPESFFEKARATKWLPTFAFGSGILLGIFEVAVIGSYAQISGVNPIATAQTDVPAAQAMLILSIMFFVSVVLFSVVGYIAGRVWRSILSVFLVWIGQVVVSLVPYSIYGPQHISGMYADGRLFQSMVFVAVIGLLTGIGASIDLSQGRKKRLRSNDPAQLVAEAVRLQWRLNLGKRAACVMSVDVAGSTKMKAKADPLRVEFSFREYQQMVEEAARRHGGYVFSTAGDGAIVAFPDSQVALDAAREIQTQMDDFNRWRNRLDHPFRVRIGLHTGETQAELEDAPFNELIDIAAHVEKVAPVGGIAVSRATAAKLPGEGLAEMAQAVDGLGVYIVMNPTL